MNFTRQFILIIVLFIMVFSVACSNGGEVSVVGEVNEPYNYITAVGNQDVSISGSEFQVRTNNCGASVSANETLARSRSFNISLNADVTTSLGGEFEGDVLVAGAKVQAAIETSLGIQIGTTETVNAQRTLETPADSISIITLQWEEVWDTGNVNIFDNEGHLKGEVPFRVLTTLRLSQKSVEEVPCSTDSTPSATKTTEFIPIPQTDTPNPPTNTPNPPTETVTPGSNAEDIPRCLVRVMGSSRVTPSGLFLQKGDLVEIIAEGDVNTNPNSPRSKFSDADGNGFYCNEQPVTGCHVSWGQFGSLVGRIGEGEWFEIGKAREFYAFDSGELVFGVNDSLNTDNLGYFDVTCQ